MQYHPSIEGQEHIVGKILPVNSPDRIDVEKDLRSLAPSPVGSCNPPVKADVMVEVDTALIKEHRLETVTFSLQQWAARFIEVDPRKISVILTTIQTTLLSQEVKRYLKITYTP